MTKPLIVQVLWSLGRAGAERVVLELSRKLSEYGFRVAIVAAGGGGEMYEEFKETGIPLFVGPAASKFTRWKTVNFLKQQIKNLQPSIWHAHLSEVWAAQALRSPCFMLHAPCFMITAHNDDQDDPWLRHILRGRAFRQADKVVAISETVQKYVQKEFHVPTSRLSLIRNAINFHRVKLREKKSFSEPARLITIGRLMPQKDHRTLLEALTQLKDLSWTLEVIGSGPERESLEQVVKKFEMMDRIQFSGSVKDVPMRLAEADIFCFPSRWEGQGLVMLEAAAAGLPIVASDLPVFRETFDHRAVRFVEKPFDKLRAGGRDLSTLWARALRDVLTHPEAALSRANQAQWVVRQEFALERMVEQYAELYRKLL